MSKNKGEYTVNVVSSEDLLIRIRRNFPEYPVPENIGIPTEALDVNNFFSGRAWTELSYKIIMEEGEGDIPAYLSFMNDEGFRYYLPAYMTMTFLNWAEDTRWLLENLPNHLMPSALIYAKYSVELGYINPVEQERWARQDEGFFAKFAPLTPAQKADVADFLRHQCDHYGPFSIPESHSRNENALRAFEFYWYQFASKEETKTEIAR